MEYQGKQHFQPVKVFDGEKGFLKTKIRDERKYNLCEENNCKLFYFTYNKKHIPKDWHHKVFTKEEELIEEIKKYLV